MQLDRSEQINISGRSIEDDSLPAIVDKKYSKIDQQVLNHYRGSHRLANISSEEFLPHAYEKGLSPVFSIPKGTIFIDRKIVSTPSKNVRNQISQNLESELIKKRISELRMMQNQYYNDQPLFKDIMKQFGLLEGGEPPVQENLADRQAQYFSYKKRLQKKLKPIISQIQLKSRNEQFFNIEKMTLLSVEGKKTRNMIINLMSEEKQKSPLSIENNRGKVFSDIEGKKIRERQRNSIKAVVVIDQKLTGKNEEVNNTLIIKTMEPKTYTSERTDFHLRRLSQPIRLREGFQGGPLTQTFKDHRQPREDKDRLKFKSLQKDSKDKEGKQLKPVKRLKKKFEPPYPTYNYRNLLWKVNYSNRLFVESPVQYEHRLKVFVGKGNNSCMVSGLISRRPWFAFTDKIQEANFSWTQLKQLSFFKRQQSCLGDKDDEKRGAYLPSSILRDVDEIIFKGYFRTYLNSEQRADERMVPRSKYFKYAKYVKSTEIRQQKMHNHLINNYVLGNKKALFNTMSNYYREIEEDVFRYLPLTFHIKEGMEDQKYFQFLKYYHKRAKQVAKHNHEKGIVKEYNAWIVKPGENSNRGNGIKMCLTLEQIKAVLKKKQKYSDGSYRTYIVQAYIQRPLLYFKRKFDLRHYIMITCVNGLIKGYWYREGYVRTTSNEYSLKDSCSSIHLTNDAVQKNLPDYGKYEKGNKISYDDLNAYIEKYYNKAGKGFFQNIYPKMRKMAADAIKAASGGIDPDKLCNNFEIFGMDFMIDSNLDVWLIEINTNPCLQLSCPLLGCIIPRMVEDALELTMDAMFPPPHRFSPKGVHYYKQLQKQNKFELVYDERVERLYEGSLQVLDSKLLEEQDDTFQDCGEEWQDS